MTPAQAMRDLALTVGPPMVAYLMWRRDIREEAVRAEAVRDRSREEQNRQAERFRDAVKAALDTSTEGTLAEVQRMHAIDEMVRLADEYSEFRRLARDTLMHVHRAVDAQHKLRKEERAEQQKAGGEGYKEALEDMARTGDVDDDVHALVYHHMGRWGLLRHPGAERVGAASEPREGSLDAARHGPLVEEALRAKKQRENGHRSEERGRAEAAGRLWWFEFGRLYVEVAWGGPWWVAAGCFEKEETEREEQ